MRRHDKKENITKANILAEQRHLQAKLNEEICLDIKVGDVILMGKYLNKSVTVKSIKKDGKGGYLVNGKSLLRARIIKDKDK